LFFINKKKNNRKQSTSGQCFELFKQNKKLFLSLLFAFLLSNKKQPSISSIDDLISTFLNVNSDAYFNFGS
jgi:hypothetical protein